MIKNIISLLVDLSYKSIFISPENTVSRSRLLLKVLFLGFSLLFIIVDKLYFLIIIPYILVYTYNKNRILQFFSALLLSMIPALWMMLTSFLTHLLEGQVISFSFYMNIFVKTILISLSIITFVAHTTPYDVSVIFSKIIKQNLYPYITWRLVPIVLKETLIAILVQSLKDEKTWKALQVSIANQLERKERIEAINYPMIMMDPFIDVQKEDNANLLYMMLIAFVIIMLLFSHYYMG